MSYYTLTRNTELSTLKFIEESVNAAWSNVSVIKSWTQLDSVTNPVICVALTNTNYTRTELGNNAFNDTYVFNIDVFATSDAMRLDLTHYLTNKLIPGWTYYTAELSSGASTTLIYTEAGRCRIDRIYDNSKVNLSTVADVRDRYRQNIVVGVTVGLL